MTFKKLIKKDKVDIGADDDRQFSIFILQQLTAMLLFFASFTCIMYIMRISCVRGQEISLGKETKGEIDQKYACSIDAVE